MDGWKTWTICENLNNFCRRWKCLERLKLKKWSSNESFKQIKKMFNKKLDNYDFKSKNKKKIQQNIVKSDLSYH